MEEFPILPPAYREYGRGEEGKGKGGGGFPHKIYKEKRTKKKIKKSNIFLRDLKQIFGFFEKARGEGK